MKKLQLTLFLSGLILLMGANNPDPYQQAVNNSNRPQEHVAKDKLRDPAIALKFAGVKPGMHVMDFFTGAGYYAFLMSDIVGPEGEVIAQNPSQLYTLFKKFRLQVDQVKSNPHFKNVRWLDIPNDDMSAIASNSQDLIMSHLVFHDAFWIGGDPHKLVQEFYRILKPGGSVVIIDHAAPVGSGDSDAIDRKGIHRIEEQFVVKMFLKAGFKLQERSNAFKRSYDDGTKPFWSKELKGKQTSRFMIKMVK